MRLKHIGLIVNPSAGGGTALQIARGALRALAPAAVLAGAAEMGADAARDLPFPCVAVDWSGQAGKARTAFLARRLVESDLLGSGAGPDALVVIGGDGTLADVAFALHTAGLATPLLGIGAGSANVGPLVTCPAAEINRLAGAELALATVDGLIAGAGGADLGLGFNDVVIGTTVLATVDGKVVDVDAAAKMRGLNLPSEPQSVWTADTRVLKRSGWGETLVAQGDQVATVIVGLPDERFYGKAIAGGLLLSSLAGDPGGCLVCDHLLVRTSLDVDAYRRSEPIVSRYVGLNEDEVIEGWGFRPGTALCADGNPLRILGQSDRVAVRVRRGLATAVRLQEVK